MARAENEKAKAAEYAFDFADWHADPTCDVSIIPHPGGGHLVFCKTHHTAANLEAVSTRLQYEASKK